MGQPIYPTAKETLSLEDVEAVPSTVEYRPEYPNMSEWPCPFCPPGTDFFRQVSALGTKMRFTCTGCGYVGLMKVVDR